MFLSLSCWSLSLSVFDMSFCVYFCMFPVCPLCCFILISMDLESEINDDDENCHSMAFEIHLPLGNCNYLINLNNLLPQSLPPSVL